MTLLTPFAVGAYLCVPYRPFEGMAGKNDEILAHATATPERFLISRVEGLDPRVVLASRLTDPRNQAVEVWQNDALLGIFIVDRIDPGVDARCHLVFFDDDLASKTLVARELLSRCFTTWELARLTLEVPVYMTTLTGFARKKLGFDVEGTRERAYFDGETWHSVAQLRKLS